MAQGVKGTGRGKGKNNKTDVALKMMKLEVAQKELRGEMVSLSKKLDGALNALHGVQAAQAHNSRQQDKHSVVFNGNIGTVEIQSIPNM